MSGTSNQPYRMYSPSLDALMQEVRHTLGDIDFQHEVVLDQVANSVADADLKTSVTAKIRAAHRAKRQPYVDLLHGLRQQHRQSFAA